MKVVCDSSVLIGLTSIDKLEILPEVLETEEVTVPKAVWEEVVIEGKGRKGADEIDADLILLDEKESREVARGIGLKILGTVGVLIRAKKLSLISNLRNQLDNLKQKANFRIGEDVYQRALSEVGET